MLTKKVIAVLAGIFMLILSAGATQQGKHVLSGRRAAFIRSFTPYIASANLKIHQQRTKLFGITEYYNRTGYMTIESRNWIQTIAAEYEVEWSLENGSFDEIASAVLDELWIRVDVVPLKLVLAQAIIETGWGKSKAAQSTHNYFGITQYGSGGRKVTQSTTRTYFLREYASINEGVEHYLWVLNTRNSYRVFREMRALYRKNEWPLTAQHLSKGLINYSELRMGYVAKLNFLIRKYLRSEYHPFVQG
ncbi:MAG: glucosaminidase domain-containing protein [Candidatus Competibacteraceae bacterium]|nr:glucosaminidase domain-containing protein [Candidatus Competibacteraceae bacterium]